MTPFYEQTGAALYCGDSLQVLPTLAAGSVGAVVTDPPAGISFMGKTWDKPGVLGISGGRAMPATLDGRNPMCRACRKHQRGRPPRAVCVCAKPDFDTLDGRRKHREAFIAFLSGAFREALRVLKPGGYGLVWAIPRTSHWTATALEDAGFEVRDRIAHLFGTGFPKGKGCLKPACEDWWLVRKPGKKVLPLGIDECRVPTVEEGGRPAIYGPPKNGADGGKFRSQSGYSMGTTTAGRWPANLVLSHHADCSGECHPECPMRLLDEQSGERSGPVAPAKRSASRSMQFGMGEGIRTGFADTGGASRFFYTAKASRRERGEGNAHPTVKPLALMSWLVRLVTPPGGRVLDLFAGSGTTLLAALQTGRQAIGIEKEAAYCEIARKRLEAARAETPLFA